MSMLRVPISSKPFEVATSNRLVLMEMSTDRRIDDFDPIMFDMIRRVCELPRLVYGSKLNQRQIATELNVGGKLVSGDSMCSYKLVRAPRSIEMTYTRMHNCRNNISNQNYRNWISIEIPTVVHVYSAKHTLMMP